MTRDPAFTAWIERAESADMVSAARQFGAKLKRDGAEHIGPCPKCGGDDRFSIRPAKGVFNCRGFGGGNVIVMVQHIGGLSFLQACETLTGEPPPNGKVRPLTESQKADLDRRRREREAEQARREREESERRAERQETAAEIFAAAVPIAGTPAEKYLLNRGLPVPPDGWPDCLRFSPSLYHELERKRFPCLVARVDASYGNCAAIWRIFITADGRKQSIANPKLGLGSAAGGAVRIGGVAERISVGEGLETSLAIWALCGFARPSWACLSTSGLRSFDPPFLIERVDIWPDSDLPLRKQGEDYASCVPAGQAAALALKSRLDESGLRCVVQPSPQFAAMGADWLVTWGERKAWVAA